MVSVAHQRRNIVRTIVYQVLLTYIFATTLCRCASIGLDPQIYEDTLERLERMYFPERFESMQEDFTIPMLGGADDDSIHENTRSFKNPFVIKRDDENDKRGNSNKSRHFYRSPFVLKRNQYELPLTLKEKFENPFAFKDAVPEVRAMYRIPSVFKRLAEDMGQNGENDDKY